MQPDALSQATAATVGVLPSHFMLDPATYQRGAELGFAGFDVYVAGRGGALGDVPADVVGASFVFFSPTTVAEAWERSKAVMAPRETAEVFIGIGHDWADAHLRDDVDLARLADVLGASAAGAPVAAAPLFAAWRAMPEPGPDRPKALVLHRLNLLRELRGALHGAALLAHGIGPHEAVSLRTPIMLGIFGYDGPHPRADDAAFEAEWKAAEAATDRSFGAAAFAHLSEAERAELAELLAALDPPKG